MEVLYSFALFAGAAIVVGSVEWLICLWLIEPMQEINTACPQEERRPAMPIYSVGHIPPASWRGESFCQVGAVSADCEATADRMAEERYVMRPGWELELLIVKDEDFEESKRLVVEWHGRNEFWKEFCRDLGVRP